MKAFRSLQTWGVIAEERDEPLWEIQWRIGQALVKKIDISKMSKQICTASIDMSIRF
jgi:hypothetical protein